MGLSLPQVSGSSAKLGGDTSYHHCTLLVDAELATLKALLKTPLHFIENKVGVNVMVTNKDMLSNIYQGHALLPF